MIGEDTRAPSGEGGGGGGEGGGGREGMYECSDVGGTATRWHAR